MSEPIAIALISSIPPTLAALVALYKVHRLSKPLSEVNAAVNHRRPGERRLIELVDDVHARVENLGSEVQEVRDELTRHRAFHTSLLEDPDR